MWVILRLHYDSLKLQVYVKVVSVDSSSGKISLSIKYVNQTTGQDLDENGVELDQENQRRKVLGLLHTQLRLSFVSFSLQEAPRRQEKSSALGAILNVTCSKCGGAQRWLLASLCFACFVTLICTGHGHLPSECFGAGKKYDLLPEDDGCELFVFISCQTSTLSRLTVTPFLATGAHSLGSPMVLNPSCT